ncbi:reverse transcriptase domain-containing protein, partial [Tanacetum coccineum]
MGMLTETDIADEFPDEHLMVLKTNSDNDEPWYADYVNYIVRKVIPPKWTSEKRKRFFSQVKYYFWDEPYAFRLCPDNIMRRCVVGNEISEILAHCHSGPTGSVRIWILLAYHLQRGKRLHIKMRRDWSEKLNDALWAFRIAYKTPTGCTPFKLVYGKAYHLPVEVEHKAYWALKQCTIDLTAAKKNHFMALNELMELRNEAYENTRIYKEKAKKWHDLRLQGDKIFAARDKVLLFNSCFRLHPGKLKSKWFGPFTVKTIYPYGAVEITDKNNFSFKVYGHRLKRYYDGSINTEENEVVELNGE